MVRPGGRILDRGLGERADEPWRGADRALELDVPGGQVALQHRPWAGALDRTVRTRAARSGSGSRSSYACARSTPQRSEVLSGRDVHDSFKPPQRAPP